MIKCIVLEQDGKICSCEADYVIFGESLCEGHSKDMHFTAAQVWENYTAHLQAIANLMTQRYGAPVPPPTPRVRPPPPDYRD